MRRSILLAIAILAMGAVPGIWQQKRLSVLAKEQRKLAETAAALGLSVDVPDDSSGTRTTKHQRETLTKQAQVTARAVIAFARDLEDLEKSGVKPDKAFEERAMEMMVRLMDLDAAQLKQVITDLRDNPEISAESRGNIIAFSIMMLSKDHPEAAVSLFSESSDLLEKSSIGGAVIFSTLSRWAELNPQAALAWIRNNEEKHPEIASDEAKQAVIAGAASRDPKLAFQLIDDMEMGDRTGAIQAILMSGNDTPEQRNAMLGALREYLGRLQSEAEREEAGGNAMEVFARTAEKGEFDSLTQWMSVAKFTSQEKEQFAGGLEYFSTKEDTGRWVEWMSRNLSEDALSGSVRELVGEWTQQDYVAAGKWLSGAPEGSAKTEAVKAYAEAVAEYEPQVAAQWALTLPPGSGRESTLKAIFQNWPASDPEGAEAFAHEHGLK